MPSERDQHRSEWLGVGAAILTGGIVVMSEWVFAVRSAAPQNHLQLANPVLILPAVHIVAGIYVMIAAHAPSCPLFGRSRVQRAEKRRQKAEYYLAKFHDIGDFYARGHGDVDMQKVNEYYTNLRNYLIGCVGNW